MDTEYMIRTANIYDVDLIDELFAAHSARYFGEKQEPPLSKLFYEYKTHRFVVFEANNPKTIVAYTEFCIYPNIGVLANDSWIEWLKCRFCVDLPITLMNTIFFNFYIHSSTDDTILKLILMEVFYREHKVAYLIVIRPPNYPPKEYEDLEKYGKVYYPIDYDMYKRKDLPTIVLMSRTTFMPVISFRKALPEDNDDVIDMIDYEEPQMREEQGDYFIAELLMSAETGKMDKDKIIVTEESDSATGGSTGMMWLSEDVDIEKLVTNFDLEGLGNLVTCSPDLPHGTLKFEVLTAEQRRYCKVITSVPYTKRRSVYLEPNQKRRLSEKERLYTKFKYISDEFNKSSTYLKTVPKTLEITFDLTKKTKRLKQSLNSASRAFVLRNFILHPSLRLEYTYYYLCAMFSAYPDRDYCVVPIAPGTKYSHSLWALLSFFIRVQHRPSCAMPDEVFVAHRSSISTELSVYALVQDDIDDVINMLHNPSERNSIDYEPNETISRLIGIVKTVSFDVLHNLRSEFSMWIVRCGNLGRENSTAVGFIILRPFTNYSTVYKQFMLPFDEDFLTFDRGEIVMLRLHPYFHMWADEILRTVAIRTSFRELLYFQLMKGFELPNDLASRMMPVEPRRLSRNWFMDANSSECFRRSSRLVDLPKINCVKDQYYLFRHNLFKTRYIGNQTALVIVGFSDICKAFLRLMVFDWNTPDLKNVNTNNCLPSVDITVLVHYGEIEAEYDHDFSCAFCDSDDDCYLSNFNTCPFVTDATQRLDLRNWIHFVAAKIECIDRNEKLICLDNHCKIYYDKMLLMCETKFGLPDVMQPRKSNPMYGIPDEGETELTTANRDGIPYNYAHINGRLDKITLYHKLIELNNSKINTKRVIVYGYCLAAHECIDFLLKHGCQTKDIVLVQPHKIQQPEFLNDPTIDTNLDNILIQMVIDMGIEVHESANFHNFTLYETAYFIKTVNFKRFGTGEELFMTCDLFISFIKVNLTARVERVLVESGVLVKNRKVLVDEDYCTNDPNIYAAGRHARIAWDVFYQYSNVNELEMAEKLIDILDLSQEPYTSERRFSKPCLFHALLPMDYKVFKITIPKRYLLGKLSNKYSHYMTTYEAGEFCRIRMSKKLIVEEIAVITRNLDRPLFFLEYFCGKHETLLNSLRVKWKLGLIKNFVTFLEEPWTEYIMHDRFSEMQAKNHATLISLLHQTHSGVKGMHLGESEFEEASKHFLEANLLKFLRKHRKEFINKIALPEDWERLSTV